MNTLSVPQQTFESRATVIVVTWGIAAFFAGFFRVFEKVPGPLFGLAVVALLATLILTYQIDPRLRRFADTISLRAIALFHAWRIFAGWIFLSHQDSLSSTFVNNAAYGDIISGFLGLSVFVLGHTKMSYVVFNTVGILDFILAVGTGLALTIVGDPGMEPILTLPLIMIPLFGVPLSGFTHYISVRRLISMKGTGWSETVS